MFQPTKPIQGDPLPPPSISAIAAAALRTARHSAIERELAETRTARDALFEQGRTLSGRLGREGSSEDAIGRELRVIQGEREKLEARIREMRQAVRPHREQHAAKVAAALQPRRTGAARRFLAALSELNAAAADLSACAVEIAAAHGSAEAFPMPSLGAAEAYARSHAGTE